MGWRETWRPDSYHGHGKQHDFFEGWYFKLADAAGSRVYAVIPGVFLGHDPADSHCFVQTLDGLTGHSAYHRYPLADFWAAAGRFEVRVGPNLFSADGLTLNIPPSDPTGPAALSFKGALSFSGLTPWPVTLTSPGIMGPYALAPFMECYHGVVSLDHRIGGRLNIGGAAVDFEGGRGYIEKDWGQAFPRGWIWMQSNHFELAGTSLTASIATIPWLCGAFPGFIVGLWHGGRLYRFATYTGAQTEELRLSDTHVTWRMAGKVRESWRPETHRLEIHATRAGSGLLHGPARTAMLQRVAESLTAEITVRLSAWRDGQEDVIFEGTGRHGGLEINGELDGILTSTT
jgi:tocopherol cyclase